MRIAISGASGMIGSALRRRLADLGHATVRLVRGRPARDSTEVAWDPDAGRIDTVGLEGIEAAVNLAGASLARWPWTQGHRRRILESRTRSTALLARTLAGLSPRPQVLVSVSAVGYYGNRGAELLTERSGHGTGFLADVCRAWESAADPALHAGIRVVTPRLGLVVSGTGGALRALRRPFQLGLGGPVGDGRQYWSWISLEDAVGVITHALEREDFAGAVNGVAPDPATNLEFTRTLGRALHRPTVLPFPAWAARLLLGGMADEMLLASQRVEPEKLKAVDFQYRYPDLAVALRHALKG